MCIDSNRVCSLLSPNAQEWIPTSQARNAPFNPFQFLPHVIFAPHSPPATAPPPPQTAIQVVTLVAAPPYKPYNYSFSFHQGFITYEPRPFYHPAPVTLPVNGCFFEALSLPSTGGEKRLEEVERPTRKSPESPPVTLRRTCPPQRLRRTRTNVEQKPRTRSEVWRAKTSKLDNGVAGAYVGVPSPTRNDVLHIEESSAASKSTVMIKNIPNQLRRDDMLRFLDQYCKEHSLQYDFLYLPMDFRKGDNLGYAFVNFTSGEDAVKFKEILQGYKWDSVRTGKGLFRSKKVCDITWARLQGKEELVRRFENTSFACNKLEFLPVVLDPARNGSDPQPAPPVIIGRLQNGAISKIQ